MPEPPSTYYWGRIYGCFFDDAAGLAAIDAIGADQVTFETDYPHADGTWPHSKEVAEKLFAGLDDDLVHKIVRGNALRMLGIASSSSNYRRSIPGGAGVAAMSDVDYPVNDFDNHYYEAIDAFTRHLDPQLGRRIIQWAEIDGRKYHVIGGKVSHAVVNPTFDPIAKAGAMSEYFRGNASGRNPLEYLREREPIRSEYRDRETRIQVMDEQGLDKIWLYPTLGMIYEQLLKHDPEGVGIMFRAFNRWLEEDWGYDYEDRIFASPYIALADLDVAVEELERALVARRHAPSACAPPRPPRSSVRSRPATPTSTRSGRASTRRASPSSCTRATAATRSTATPRRASRPSSPAAARPSIGMMSIERAIYDFLASLIFDQLFDRFPNLRVASVENGAEFLPDLFRKFKSINRKIPGLFKEDPVETFRRHVWINPFWEDDVYEIVDLMGADRVVFGSDWPHIEGLPNPRDYAVEIKELDARVAAPDHARQRRSAQPAPAGLNPSNIRRIADEPCAPPTGVARRVEDLGRAGGDALDGRVAVDETVRDLEARPSRSARRPREKHSPVTGHASWASHPTSGATSRGCNHSLSSALGGNGPKPVSGPGLGVGRDHVGGDPGVAPLRRHRQREPDHAHLGHAVDRAAGDAAERGARRHVHEAAAAAFGHHRPRRPADVERAAQLRVDHRVELRLGELGERRHAHLAGVVHHDVDGAERVERGVDDGRATLGRRDGVAVRDRLAAGGDDLGDDRRRPVVDVGASATPSVSLMPTPRSLTSTCAPRAANRSAYSRPRLRPAPVTTTTFPSNRSSSRHRHPFPLLAPSGAGPLGPRSLLGGIPASRRSLIGVHGRAPFLPRRDLLVEVAGGHAHVELRVALVVHVRVQARRRRSSPTAAAW